MQNLIKLFSLIIFFSSFIYAQYSEDLLYDEYKDEFSKEYLKIGLLVQVGGFYQYEQPDGSNGFALSNFRLKLSGEFDKGIGYMVQTAFTGSPAILDARIYYKISKAFVVDAGLYKTSFSREFLISAANIDFVNRAQLTVLAPNRQIGVQARGVIPGTVLSYAAGVFNGNRFSNNQNDNNEFLYTGRLALNTDQGSQFTSKDFSEMVIGNQIKMSMDSKGRALDNIFIERLWRSLKYEDIYLKEYQSISELREGLKNYFDFYNNRRIHQSLNYKTPAEVYFN